MPETQYSTVVLALELDPEADAHIVKQALETKQEFGARIILVHAVEHLSNYGAAYGASAGVDIEQTLVEEAVKEVAVIAEKMGIASEDQVVKIGPAKQIIIDEAEKVNASLIIVGSHGKHGVRLLLGSTANAVLHSAHCDVLAVRVKS